MKQKTEMILSQRGIHCFQWSSKAAGGRRVHLKCSHISLGRYRHQKKSKQSPWIVVNSDAKKDQNDADMLKLASVKDPHQEQLQDMASIFWVFGDAEESDPLCHELMLSHLALFVKKVLKSVGKFSEQGALIKLNNKKLRELFLEEMTMYKRWKKMRKKSECDEDVLQQAKIQHNSDSELEDDEIEGKNKSQESKDAQEQTNTLEDSTDGMNSDLPSRFKERLEFAAKRTQDMDTDTYWRYVRARQIILLPPPYSPSLKAEPDPDSAEETDSRKNLWMDVVVHISQKQMEPLAFLVYNRIGLLIEDCLRENFGGSMLALEKDVRLSTRELERAIKKNPIGFEEEEETVAPPPLPLHEEPVILDTFFEAMEANSLSKLERKPPRSFKRRKRPKDIGDDGSLLSSEVQLGSDESISNMVFQSFDTEGFMSMSCLFCRGRKARCTRESPTCQRCVNFGMRNGTVQVCEYPTVAVCLPTPPPPPAPKTSYKEKMYLSGVFELNVAGPLMSRICVNCKLKKIRCSREIPSCAKCKSRPFNSAPCEYPSEAYVMSPSEQAQYISLLCSDGVIKPKSKTQPKDCNRCWEANIACSRHFPMCKQCQQQNIDSVYCEYPQSEFPDMMTHSGSGFGTVKHEQDDDLKGWQDNGSEEENRSETFNRSNQWAGAELKYMTEQCLQCLKKKGACSQEFPSCKQCNRSKKGLICQYPMEAVETFDPPDEKPEQKPKRQRMNKTKLLGSSLEYSSNLGLPDLSEPVSKLVTQTVFIQKENLKIEYTDRCLDI